MVAFPDTDVSVLCLCQIHVSSGTYFFTVNLLERRDGLLVKDKRNERGIWQRRFCEHVVTDEDDLTNHINYIYINPLKHGYVTKVSAWLYSSFHRDVRLGIYPANWAE